MRVVIGSDHAGVTLKERLRARIEQLGHQVVDVGTSGPEPVDYPDIARSVGEPVAAKSAERGILICGSGVGASIAANKIPGVRAAVCHDCYSASQGVEHDDMNVLTLGARVIGDELAISLVSAYLSAAFSGEERHQRRLDKMLSIEKQFTQQSKP